MILLSALQIASASAIAVKSGTVEVALPSGQTETLPMLRTDVTTHIDGDIASVKLVQTFANPHQAPIDARYLFPLPPNAAVHAMQFTTGQRVIVGEIKRKQEAEQKFQEAKAQGKQAALLQQHRANVFQQDVANLVPGQTVEVEITYAHTLTRTDGVYDFHFPMVVGPRYVSSDPVQDGEPEALNTWAVGSAPDNPKTIDPDRVGITVHLDGGLPVQNLASPTHSLDIQGAGSKRVVKLASNRTIDNGDFVLQYQLAGDEVVVSQTTWADAGHGFVNLLVEPPKSPAADTITPRQITFLLDTSCSMNGNPLHSTQRFMRQVLTHTRPTDHFSIVKFSTKAEAFESEPIPATSANVERAVQYVDALTADGGTEVRAGIRKAFEMKKVDGAVPIVVFLTDGLIGRDDDVLRLVESKRGDSRIFSFGMGRQVNRFLLEELGRIGRGTASIVEGRGDATSEADALAARLDAPVLTDVRVDWGGAPVRNVYPQVLPDLFAGQSLRILAKYDAAGTYPIAIEGRIAGKPARLPVKLELPTTDADNEALPVVWARGQIHDRMQQWRHPSNGADKRAALQEEVTVLGLEHDLVTRWTSFLAVDHTPVTAPAPGTQVANVPTPSPAAFKPVSSGSWGGSSAPEPATWAALLLMGALGGGSLARGRRRRELE